MPFIRRSWPLLAVTGFTLLALFVFTMFLNWGALSLTVKLTDFASVLAPLAFASAVIERAVEILVSPWRDAEASKLERVVAAVKARPSDLATNAQNAADLQAASDALHEYRGATQRYAFAVSLTLSVLVSIAGVRALGPFADPAKLKDTSVVTHAQYTFFLCMDVALSAGLLAGGADGVHSVVNSITSFFNATAAKSNA